MPHTLSRVNIENYNSELAQTRKQLLSDAAFKLGYKPSDAKSLMYRLLALGIVPFKTDEVKAYKSSKAKTGMYSGTRNVILYWSISGGVLIGCIAARWVIDLPKHNVLDIIFFVGAVFGALASFFGLMPPFWDAIGHGRRTNRQWNSSTIPSYEGMIPDHVLNTALQIKNTIPEATLSVVYLAEVQDYKERPMPDPFLRVTSGNEEYYVEQWDEKDLPRID